MSISRQSGYYWVMHVARTEWEIAYWHPHFYWQFIDSRKHFSDADMQHIGTRVPDDYPLPDKDPLEQFADWQENQIKRYAFPGRIMGIIGDTEQEIPVHGMTKREYFIAHAPTAPDWWIDLFKSSLKKPVEPKYWDKYRAGDKIGPEPDDVLTIMDLDTLRSWQHDPCFDLPPHLQWYQEIHERHQTELRSYNLAVKSDRFFAWREYYADEQLRRIAN